MNRVPRSSHVLTRSPIPSFQYRHQPFIIPILTSTRKASNTGGVYNNAKIGNELKLNGSYNFTESGPVYNKLREAGFHDARAVFHRCITGAVDCMAQRRTPRELATHIIKSANESTEDGGRQVRKHRDTALLDKPEKGAEALFISSSLLSHPSNAAQYARVAEFMVKTAIEMGNVPASVYAHLKETRSNSPQDIPSTAKVLVRDAAQKRESIAAMSAYVEYLYTFNSDPESITEGYEIVRDLWNMCEPARQTDLVVFGMVHPLPVWKLMSTMATKYLEIQPNGPYAEEALRYRDEAILGGAHKYQDPEAINIVSKDASTKYYSDSWLDLKTKVAMNGDPDACFEVGKYHLEKNGWYPCPPIDGPPSQSVKVNPQGQIGLDWLELSAALSTKNAKAMASRFLVVALVLREHHKPTEGLAMLDVGIEELQNTAENRNDASIWISKLESFRKGWNGAFSARAAHSLGPPKLTN